MTTPPATLTKTRTITLTDRRPVRVTDSTWPAVAVGEESRDDADQPGNQPNREWTNWVRIRQHADGRALVYALSEYTTRFQGASGYTYRGGELLDAGADLPAAVRRVADSLLARGGDDAIRQAAHLCIADLEPEDL